MEHGTGIKTDMYTNETEERAQKFKKKKQQQKNGDIKPQKAMEEP